MSTLVIIMCLNLMSGLVGGQEESKEILCSLLQPQKDSLFHHIIDFVSSPGTLKLFFLGNMECPSHFIFRLQHHIGVEQLQLTICQMM